MTTPLHFGAMIKIPYGNLNPMSLNQPDAQQFAQQWQANYKSARPVLTPPPPPDNKEGARPTHPPKPPGPLEQFAIRMDDSDIYVANAEHALLLNSMPILSDGRKIKFDVIA